ncbi:hypothetical protein [Vibrio viridaestus]|uniref:hypothetical protein n=1 Tax=Vibrio viridaestus TaxID=2487322 RepID=UPI001AA06F3C|nr:hypothetical protein [Vibrio viridaestus]
MESVKDHALTEDDLLAAPDSKYMNEEQLAFFEKIYLPFTNQQRSIYNKPPKTI